MELLYSVYVQIFTVISLVDWSLFSYHWFDLPYHTGAHASCLVSLSTPLTPKIHEPAWVPEYTPTGCLFTNRVYPHYAAFIYFSTPLLSLVCKFVLYVAPIAAPTDRQYQSF